MRSKPIIIGIGEIFWDISTDKKKIGGIPFHFALHASKVGAESYIISAVGNDSDGRALIGNLKRAKINQFVRMTDFPTGTACINKIGNIFNYKTIENVAWDYIELTDEMQDLVVRADAICFGILAQRSPTSRKTIHTLLKLATSKTFKILCLDLSQNFYTKEIIEDSLNLCDSLVISDTDFIILKEMFAINGESILEVCNWFQAKHNLKYLFYKSDTGYSIVYSSQTYSFIKTPHEKVENMVIKGTFVSIFITSILTGKKIAEAHVDAVNRVTQVYKKTRQRINILLIPIRIKRSRLDLLIY